MAGSSCSSSVIGTASQAGSHFVEQYYQMLRQQPEFVHHFYTDSSTMIRVDGQSTATVSAISEIHTLVQSLHFTEIEIKTLNSVKSWSEGITVVVSGSVKSDCFSGWRKFVQTFSLAPQKEKGYFVINDIFHFVSEKDLSDVIYTKHRFEIYFIKRKHGESVEDFLFRFTKETSLIPEADDKLKISGFIIGVRNDELIMKLYENNPQTFEDMIDRVKGFVRGKRAIAFLEDADKRKPAYSTRSNNRKQNRFRPYRPTRRAESRMEQPITFPAIRTDDHKEGPLVITARTGGYRVVQNRNVHWR